MFAAEEERAKLFEGSSNVEMPRMRTHQEILTKYKFGGDAAAAAAHAKDKLMQRQEKLEVREYISILCALHLFHWCHP
jgi:syntaxin-binding protein 5